MAGPSVKLNAIGQARILSGLAFVEETLMHINQQAPSDGLAHLIQLARLSKLEREQANKLFQTANDCGLDELQQYIERNMPNARVIALFASVTAAVARSKLKSEQASFRASATRKKQENDEAAALWKAWQDNLAIYENKARFIADVTEKFQVAPNTARRWFDEFRKETSNAWEVKFGRNYPKKHQ
ncbi:MAG: hypothetical protein HY850_02800 [Betaproteobacteria bacterium]|nr:hypothetical protein [Betaproteobacteria bacterium]